MSSNKDEGVTLAIVFEHMQGMEQRLHTEFDVGLKRLESKIDKVSLKVDNLEIKVDRNHTQTMVALDNIDGRLDDLEIVELPAIKKVVGMK